MQTLTFKKPIVTRSVWVYENLNVTTYVPKQELRDIAVATLQTILKNPKLIDKIHKETIRLNQEYFKFAEKIRKQKLQRLSNKQLLLLHKRLLFLQRASHCYSLTTTWFVDSDEQDFTKWLLRFLGKRINDKKLTQDKAAVFSVLTTSQKPTLAQNEEEQLLKIVSEIQKDKKLARFFKNHTTEVLEKRFSRFPARLKKIILRHHYRWCWVPYTYLGPSYKLDYYLEVWRGLAREGVDPQKEIRKIKSRSNEVQIKHKKLISELGLSSYEKHLFDIAAEIAWLKGFRKDCYFHGFFALDLLLLEIGKRAGLSLLQAKYLRPEELPASISGKDFSDVANERIKFMAVVQLRDQGKILTGKNARSFLKTLNIEKSKALKSASLSGTCACPGYAKGSVKIVNLPEEMNKMQKGDIMVAHATYPALVPAMKKAAAIVTEEGGITCHAAIVSREMQTPCIVGVRDVTGVLKDGDLVEVDANKGIVRKL